MRQEHRQTNRQTETAIIFAIEDPVITVTLISSRISYFRITHMHPVYFPNIACIWLTTYLFAIGEGCIYHIFQTFLNCSSTEKKRQGWWHFSIIFQGIVPPLPTDQISISARLHIPELIRNGQVLWIGSYQCLSRIALITEIFGETTFTHSIHKTSRSNSCHSKPCYRNCIGTHCDGTKRNARRTHWCG